MLDALLHILQEHQLVGSLVIALVVLIFLPQCFASLLPKDKRD